MLMSNCLTRIQGLRCPDFGGRIRNGIRNAQAYFRCPFLRFRDRLFMLVMASMTNAPSRHAVVVRVHVARAAPAVFYLLLTLKTMHTDSCLRMAMHARWKRCRAEPNVWEVDIDVTVVLGLGKVETQPLAHPSSVMRIEPSAMVFEVLEQPLFVENIATAALRL